MASTSAITIANHRLPWKNQPVDWESKDANQPKEDQSNDNKFHRPIWVHIQIRTKMKCFSNSWQDENTRGENYKHTKLKWEHLNTCTKSKQ